MSSLIDYNNISLKARNLSPTTYATITDKVSECTQYNNKLKKKASFFIDSARSSIIKNKNYSNTGISSNNVSCSNILPIINSNYSTKNYSTTKSLKIVKNKPKICSEFNIKSISNRDLEFRPFISSMNFKIKPILKKSNKLNSKRLSRINSFRSSLSIKSNSKSNNKEEGLIKYNKNISSKKFSKKTTLKSMKKVKFNSLLEEVKLIDSVGKDINLKLLKEEERLEKEYRDKVNCNCACIIF